MVYPEGSDFVTPLHEVIKQALTADDTGWTAVPVEGSFNGTVEIRRVNASVTLHVNVRYGNSSNGDTVCRVPSGYRPSQNLYFPWATNSTALGCQALLTPTGFVNIFYSSQQPGTNHFVRLTATWPRD